MREIKFRAWDKHDKVMCIKTSHLDSWFDDRRYELMQYTGLHDVNNKEIYEEDIIKVHDDGHDFITEVKWDKGGFVIYLESKWFVSMIYNSISRIEIQGNIYENPELIRE